MRKNPAGCWLHVPDLPEITCPALRLSANQERERTIVKATTPDRPRLLVYRLLMRFYNCRYELPAIAFAWPERYVWGQSKKISGRLAPAKVRPARRLAPEDASGSRVAR